MVHGRTVGAWLVCMITLAGARAEAQSVGEELVRESDPGRRLEAWFLEHASRGNRTADGVFGVVYGTGVVAAGVGAYVWDPQEGDVEAREALLDSAAMLFLPLGAALVGVGLYRLHYDQLAAESLSRLRRAAADGLTPEERAAFDAELRLLGKVRERTRVAMLWTGLGALVGSAGALALVAVDSDGAPPSAIIPQVVLSSAGSLGGLLMTLFALAEPDPEQAYRYHRRGFMPAEQAPELTIDVAAVRGGAALSVGGHL